MSIADLFCDRIESAQRASRWGIGRASIYLRGMGVDGMLLKEADAKLVYTDEESVVDPPQVAYELTGDELDMGDGRTAKLVRPVALRAKAMEAGSIFEFTATITSNQIDRDGDRLEPTGAQVDMLGPLLWNHLSTEPIGKPVKVIAQNSKRLVMRFAIADAPLGRDIAQLVEFGALRRMSHGFIPEDYEEMTKDGQFQGWHVKKFEVLEFSIVSVASNRDAVIAAMSRDKLCHPLVKGWAGRLFDERPVIVRGVGVPDPADAEQTPPAGVIDPATEAEPQSIQKPDGKAILDDSVSGGQEAAPPVPDSDLDFPAEEKPYTQEHACRLRDPSAYKTCRRTTRKHEGKEYSVLTCQRKDDSDKWEEQAFRYDKEVWTEASARSHCKDHDGTFEAASESATDPPRTKGKVPGDPPSGGGEGKEGEWSKPSLSDFTDKMWEDCSMMEKNAIAKHFAWYADMDTFGALKLPHHFPDSGKPSLNGVRNALARAGQVDGISGDLEKVRAHLQAHMPEKAAETAATSHSIKSGRTLSKANESSIRDAQDDCDEIAGMEGMSRAAKALATRAAKSLESVLESAAATEERTEDKRAKKPDIAVMVAKAVSGAIRRAKG